MNRIRHILLIIALTAICNTAFADDKIFEEIHRRIDSLKNIPKTQSLSEYEEMMIYYHLTLLYASFDMDSTIHYGNLAIAPAEKFNETEKAIIIYHNVGVAHCLLNNCDTAIVILNKAIQIAIATRSSLEINTLWLIAYVYSNQAKYIAAIDLYMKLLLIFEQHGGKYMDKYVAGLCNLAELNRKLGNMGVAIQYLDKAAELVEQFAGDYVWRISHIFNEYSTVYLLKDNIGRALEYAIKADSVNTGSYVINKCLTKVLLAKISLRLDDCERSLEYIDEAMKYANLLKNNNLYIDIWKVLSDVYLKQGRYSEAEAEALKAWHADSTNIYESRAVAVNLVLANIYMHNTKKAMYYFKRYSELNEQYSEKSLHAAVYGFSVKYETETVEMQMASMRRQKLLQASVCIACILLAFAVWVVIMQKGRQKQSENQLIAIRSIIEGENRERERIARDLNHGVTEMITEIKTQLADMKNAQTICDNLDECIEEVQHVVAGMIPSSLTRFGIKIALDNYCSHFPQTVFNFYGNDKRFNEKIEATTYYCACELVNNAVKHSSATLIDVRLTQENNRILLNVRDNGRGFDPTAVAKGSGLKNIYHRIIAYDGIINTNTSLNNGVETNIELNISN
jgi:signal transduction histidine kinase